MQRVLSFRAGRGFGESNEYVTKRMCFSFLFSVGFLCLLGGFLLGKFVSDRTVIMDEQKKLDEISENGLKGQKSVKDVLLNKLNESSFHQFYDSDPVIQRLRRMEINRIRDIFTDLDIFQLNAKETNRTTVGTICGSQEPDRYVVLSASGEGFDVAAKVARVFQDIYREEKIRWRPKRTLIFCVFFDSTDYCSKKFLNSTKPNIAAYIAIHGNAARGEDEISVSGSGMVQSTIMDAVKDVREYHGNTFNATTLPKTLSRLDFDVPHAVLSFMDENSTDSSDEHSQRILGQIVALSMWRLSEETFFQWDPKYFNDTMNESLALLKSEELKEIKENLNETVTTLLESIGKFNLMINNMNPLKCLDVRMVNDRLLDLDRALLCPDSNSKSKTDFSKFELFLQEDPQMVKEELKTFRDCYAAANEILSEQAYCRRIFKEDDN